MLPRFSLILFQKAIKPRECFLQRINTVARLAQTVALARIAHQHRFHAATPERHVHFFSLSDVDVVVLLAVNEECRRLRTAGVTKRRPLPEQFVVVLGKAAELRMNQILIERGRIEADQVADAGD